MSPTKDPVISTASKIPGTTNCKKSNKLNISNNNKKKIKF